MASCLLFDILHPFSLGDKLHPITINGTFFFKVTHNPEISLLISVYVHIFYKYFADLWRVFEYADVYKALYLHPILAYHSKLTAHNHCFI